ncbi:LysR substrate-binding domain-containing protein [Azohydromonas lata]|uniref:LysR substrate-binding domain-containing protein n=2 Tax=Azohydromonas lata TaxID=45677 RepID=A0ABU5IFV7_9BURK|nr:LysR substrate-binding domain-containing protein [Azohydromonas lata]MDZ5457838.1 LysR substrate-binding domain-containing protein [Azohydromonas lata]
MSERLMAPVLADLHLLTVLADTRSYTQAARRLGISKASASARISELERAAGVPLVRRGPRSVALTEAGQQLVEEVQESFTRIEQGFNGVRDLVGAPRGLVRVSAPVAFGRQVVAPLLPPFLLQYPDIRLELELSDRLVNLPQEGFDLAIRHTDAPPQTHVAWPLCPTRSHLVASPGYVDRHGEPQHPSVLAGHQCLAYLRGGAGQRWDFEPAAPRKRAAERVSVAVGGPFKANNSELLREAALGGLGIALLPDFSCTAALRCGQLVELLPDWKPVGVFGATIYALRPYSPQVPRAVQCLVDWLKERLGGGLGG